MRENVHNSALQWDRHDGQNSSSNDRKLSSGSVWKERPVKELVAEGPNRVGKVGSCYLPDSTMGRGLQLCLLHASWHYPCPSTIKDQEEKSWRIYSGSKFAVLLPSASPPLSPLYLCPGAQISTVGSVKPFFPSFTSTGFSVRVCQTRICASRDTKQHGAVTLTLPCHLPAPTTLCKYFSCPFPFCPCSHQFFSIVLYFYLPPHSCCLYM